MIANRKLPKMNTTIPLTEIIEQVKQCNLCAGEIPFAPKPVFRISETAKILIVGQAPGVRVHQTGIPWNDPSGDRLRAWLSLSRADFYDVRHIAIIPTGLCYPGKGPSGDLPPRKICAPEWHPKLTPYLRQLKLILLVGNYAQHYYLEDKARKTLTETVLNWRDYLPEYFPLPHPSPRNQLWLKRNPWFEQETVADLRRIVKTTFES